MKKRIEENQVKFEYSHHGVPILCQRWEDPTCFIDTQDDGMPTNIVYWDYMGKGVEQKDKEALTEELKKLPLPAKEKKQLISKLFKSKDCQFDTLQELLDEHKVQYVAKSFPSVYKTRNHVITFIGEGADMGSKKKNKELLKEESERVTHVLCCCVWSGMTAGQHTELFYTSDQIDENSEIVQKCIELANEALNKEKSANGYTVEISDKTSLYEDTEKEAKELAKSISMQTDGKIIPVVLANSNSQER